MTRQPKTEVAVCLQMNMSLMKEGVNQLCSEHKKPISELGGHWLAGWSYWLWNYVGRVLLHREVKALLGEAHCSVILINDMSYIKTIPILKLCIFYIIYLKNETTNTP